MTTKVLYVEHDGDNLYMLKRRLERCGDFEVLAAEDSEQGCKLAVSEHPDVILMDLEMPVMDRWEPVRTLKKDPRTRNIPIIGMSAYAEASEREKAMATGWNRGDFAALHQSANGTKPPLAIGQSNVRSARILQTSTYSAIASQDRVLILHGHPP